MNMETKNVHLAKARMEQAGYKFPEIENDASDLEMLNQRTQKHLDEIEARIAEQAAKATYRQVMSEKRINAILNMAAMTALCLTICVALAILTYINAVPLWLSIPCTFAIAMFASFRCGWLWHEIKGLEVR